MCSLNIKLVRGKVFRGRGFTDVEEKYFPSLVNNNYNLKTNHDFISRAKLGRPGK